MGFTDFNHITAKKDYTYRRNPHHDQSFVILKQLGADGQYLPIGNYTVIDQDEDMIMSEKKVMNLIALMNDEDELIDMRGDTQSRMLFHRASSDDPDKTHIIFYALGDQGVSTESAVLSLQEGLEDA